MIKNLVKNFKNGGYKQNGKWYNNVVNGGRAIKRTEDGEYFFYCDSVNQEKLEEFCEENQLDWDMGVIPSRRMNVYGTKERVLVLIWDC